MSNIILVDGENIPQKEISALIDLLDMFDTDYKIIMFFGERQIESLRTRYPELLVENENLQVKVVKFSGKDALDFMIISEVGRLSVLNPKSNIIIFSQDRIFEVFAKNTSKMYHTNVNACRSFSSVVKSIEGLYTVSQILIDVTMAVRALYKMNPKNVENFIKLAKHNLGKNKYIFEKIDANELKCAMIDSGLALSHIDTDINLNEQCYANFVNKICSVYSLQTA